MTAQGRYHWSVGETGLSRRQTLNELINPSTQQFLHQSGLCAGMNILDIGCGIGTMSCWLAEQTGPSGRVIAIDNSPEQIAIAKEFAHEQGLSNIEFLQLDADEIDQITDSFDLIYCRFLLIHLNQPEAFLKKVYSHLDAGGVFACESTILGREYCFPKLSAFDRWSQLNHDVFLKLDKDPQTGQKLHHMLENIGFHDLSGRLFQPILKKGNERQELLINDLREQQTSLTELGLSSDDEIDELCEELYKVINDDAYFIAYCQSCQVSGIK